MPRKNAAAPKQGLCYDATMKVVATPDVAKKVVRRRRPLINQKHIAPPLSAEQISKGVGVTKKDAALVRKVLRRLGYLQEDEQRPSRKTAKATAKEQGKPRQS